MNRARASLAGPRPGRGLTVCLLLLLAGCSSKGTVSGDFKTAITEYEAYLAHQKSGLLANAARRSLAYAYESAGQFAQAIPIYDQLVGVFDRESSAEFLMAGARCAQAQHQTAEAEKRLRRLLDEYGDTSVAGRARITMGEIGAH